MSRASKMTMVGSGLFAAATIVFVHFQQKAEKEVCHPPLDYSHWPASASKE
jgi:protein PET117